MAIPFSTGTSRTGGLIGKSGGPGNIRGGVRVIGVTPALAKLKGVDSVVRLNLGAMLSQAAVFVQQRAKEYVPVETGNLQQGIQITKLSSYTWDVTASSREGGVSDKNWYEYAPFVEEGANGRPGSYFMARAFADVKPIVAAELKVLAARLQRF
jgi:HK97 gp10 family phage protein